MIRTMLAINLAAAVFSGIWLLGHVTVKIFDWEFWFALGYLGVAVTNLVIGTWCRKGNSHGPLGE